VRYIDPEMVGQNLPEGWTGQAQKAENAVAALEPAKRTAVISKHSQVWQDLKDTLKCASHNKCWYCESIDIRSDNAVDHFRPKNAVAECPDHGGYWWLAFKWENFRFCCTYCNSRRINQVTGQRGGKADHFPLKEESYRAQWPADNLADEEPLLLDPCAAADPRHLWFDEDGQAVPNPVFGNTDSYPYKRAETSIRFFHLNHPDIADQRKELCNRMRRRVEEADRYFNKYYSDGDATALGAFGDALRDLNVWLAPKEPYSSAARAMLMGLRGTHQVVDVVLASA
jgi:uncharacterized protein (TIGR02646 family)